MQYSAVLPQWSRDNISTFEYELVDANGGIQKVRVEPATRSAVATCNENGFIVTVIKCDIWQSHCGQSAALAVSPLASLVLL